MRPTVPRLAGALSSATLAAVLAFPAGAAATTNEPIAQTGGMTATLPLLGTTLTVDVSLDPTGIITGVLIGGSSDLGQTVQEPTKVRFETADGTTSVSVKAKGARLAMSARAGSLAEISGSGTWAADVFGTGTKSTVAYTIGDDGSGNPTLDIGTIVAAPDIDATERAPKASTGHGHDDDRVAVSGGATFASDGYVKRLAITVTVNKEEGTARLSFTLTGKDRQRLTGTLEELAAAGTRTWSAHLCDGTAVSLSYHIGPGAIAVYEAATGGTAKVRSSDHGFTATFDGSRVGARIGVSPNKQGTYTISVKGISGNCGTKSQGSANPSSGRDGKGMSGGSSGGSRDGSRDDSRGGKRG